MKLRFVARINCVTVRQETTSHSATTHTIYRYQPKPLPFPKPHPWKPQKISLTCMRPND